MEPTEDIKVNVGYESKVTLSESYAKQTYNPASLKLHFV